MTAGSCVDFRPVPLLLLVPTYVLGGNFYECGGPLSYLTISYLEDAPAAEWTAAVLACLCIGRTGGCAETGGIGASDSESSICNFFKIHNTFTFSNRSELQMLAVSVLKYCIT